MFGEYMERGERLPDMEEKKNVYVGYGKRIHKNKIGIIEEGNFHGSFIVYIDNPNDIEATRIRLHQKVLAYAKAEFENAKKNVDATEKANIDQPLHIRDY